MKKKRSIMNKQLFISFIALLGYFFKLFSARRIDGADFFTETRYLELKKRIEDLREGTSALWGHMRVEQMLRHLNLSIGSGQGVYDLPDESYYLSRTIIKWIVIDLYAQQPKGLQLPLCMAITPDSLFDFAAEKEKLLQLLYLAGNATRDNQWKSHCYFGKLTVNQWGKLCTMHIDYHLKQFSG